MLTESSWTRPDTGETCTVWLQEPPNGRGGVRRCWLVLDAELYLHRMYSAEITAAAQACPEAADVLVVFLSHQGQSQRHRDYVCSDTFSQALVINLLPWLRTRYPALTATGHAAIGLSLSGLAAAHLALHFPETFPAAICQSPSFWWEDERFLKQLTPAQQPVPRYWVSVGRSELEQGVSHPPSGLRQNVCQLDACRHTVDALNGYGYAAELHEYDGGHDCAFWQRELPAALKWLSAREGGN